MRARDYSDPFDGMDDLDRRLRDLENASPLENASVTGGTVRLIRATLRVEAGGSIELVGTLDGEGRFNWAGPWKFDSGDGEIGGNVDLTGILRILGGGKIILGDITIDGATGDIRVGDMVIRSGQIRAGDVIITTSGGGVVQVGSLQINGASGGTIYSPSTVYIQGDGATAVRVVGRLVSSDLLVFGGITGQTLSISGAKTFRMVHPSKPDHWLRHGATESPVSGTEYTGRATIGDDGSAVVPLPDYFEALNKPDNRTVQLTPVGEPFPVGASEVADGMVIVYGQPGREVFWLVKAERRGGDFLIEEAISHEPTDE